MKRDTTTLIVCLVVLGAVGLLIAPQIAAMRNPPASGLPNQTANLAALTVAAIPALTAIPTGTFTPTVPLTSTVSITPTLSLTATLSLTTTVPITRPVSVTPTNILSSTFPVTATVSLTSTFPNTQPGSVTPGVPITRPVSVTPTRTITSTGIISSALSLSRANAMRLRADTMPVSDVTIEKFLYAPVDLIVPVGTTVKWTQLDKEPHTVSAGTPENRNRLSPFNSATLTTVGTTTYEFKFQEPGFYPYFCIYHPAMLGSVEVTSAQPSPTLEVRSIAAVAPVVASPTLTPTPTTRATSSPTRLPQATVTPFVATPPPGAQVVATGLINPRGFTKGPDGALYVAEAGTVQETVIATNPLSGTHIITSTNSITTTRVANATLTPPSPQPRGTVNPICEGQLPSYDKLAAGCPGAQGPQINHNGRISRIAPDGTRTTLAENLPVTLGPFNDVFGVNSVAFIDDVLYVIIAAGPTRGHPDFPTGVYRVANGSTTLVANLEEFQKQNPPKFIPDDYNYSLPYDVLALNGKLYITDGNAAVVFEVDPSQPLGRNVRRIIDLSPTHNVLTGISAGADGAIYFTDFTPAPYPIGGAQVFKWSPHGGLATVTAGLSIATGIAIAPDGTMYASEFATDLPQAPFIVPPGRVVKIGTDGKVETIATPLVYPTALRWLDGALYVTNYGVNAVDGEEGNGAILQLQLP